MQGVALNKNVLNPHKAIYIYISLFFMLKKVY